MSLRSYMVLLLSVGLMSGCAQQTPEMQLINDVAEAIGGMRTVEDTESLVIDGSGSTFNIGQNRTPEETPGVRHEISEFTRKVDFVNGRWRHEQLRTTNYLTGRPVFDQRHITALDGDVAFDVASDDTIERVSSLEAKNRKDSLYHNPVGIIKAAIAEGATTSSLRQESGQNVVDVMTVDGDQYTLYVDAETQLPTKVTSASYNSNLGDVTLETEFDAYGETGGLGFEARLTLPRKITRKLDGLVAADYTISNVAVNGDVGDLSAPEEASGAEAPTPSANVSVEEVSTGIWHLTGQSHHSVLVEFPEYLVLIEAPQNDTRTLAVIEKARELQPEKSLRYVINTHHHFDHSGGIRAAVSEGLTVITHELNRAFFEDIVGRQHTVLPDALAMNSQPLAIETVPGDDRYVLESGRQSLEIYPILNSPHGDTLLMVYFPRERLLVEADVFSPGSPAAPFAANLLENIEENNLRVNRVVPIHGDVVDFSELEETVKAESSSQ